MLLAAGLFILSSGSGRPAQAATTPVQEAAAAAARSSASRGPEGVPLEHGRPLGPARSPRSGQSAAGVVCGSGEQAVYHVHAHLVLFVNGRPRAVPMGIGIAGPRRITHSAAGDFVSGGSCFSFLHTHAADGVIHIEAPGVVMFRLGQFFAVWQQRLDRSHLGRTSGHVVAYVNGRRWHGDPRAIPLRKHAQITLEIGRPHVAPPAITFPAGL